MKKIFSKVLHGVAAFSIVLSSALPFGISPPTVRAEECYEGGQQVRQRREAECAARGWQYVDDGCGAFHCGPDLPLISPSPAPEISIGASAGPAIVTQRNQKVLVQWEADNADYCEVDGIQYNARDEINETISAAKTYRIDCYNNGGKHAMIELPIEYRVPAQPDPPPQPTFPDVSVTIRATPQAVSSGISTTISWKSSGATSCSYLNVAQPVTGSFVDEPRETKTYTIVCSNEQNSNSASVTVYYDPPVEPLLPPPPMSDRDLLITGATILVPIGPIASGVSKAVGPVAEKVALSAAAKVSETPLGRRIVGAVVEFGGKIVDGIGTFFEGVGQKVERLFGRGAAEVAVQSAEQYLKENWYKSTFKTVEDSIEYHYDKHVIENGLNLSRVEYTQEALEFFQKNQSLGEKVILRDNTPGISINLGDSMPGGYWKADGRVVSYWR